MAETAEDFQIPFLIGVVGHRDLVDAELSAIRAAVATLLQRLQGDAPNVPLRLICSMAAGADLLVADVAVQVGISIIALLPYARALCREDLESAVDRAAFDRICDASDVVELSMPDGVRLTDIGKPGELRDRQLQRAGSLIARYSGLMIAIWNGLDTEFRAGTARSIQFRRQGVVPTDDLLPAPHDVLLSPQDVDLNYEIRLLTGIASGARWIFDSRLRRRR